MVAAATTSLPETPGGLRNWDYRYAWIRDSTFMLWGLYTLGFDEEANDFFYFIRDVVTAEKDELQIMYGIGGETELEEFTLDHLSGYENARPVRVGNGAYNQRQHDVWGALLDSIWLHTKSRDGLAESTWQILVKQVEDAIRHWREPDRGIWEVRGEPRHFTSSKLMCWVACDRGARLARLREDSARAERWQEAADEIHADICANGVDERGVFVQHYDTTALDASCLMVPLVRFLPPDDPRVIATVNAIDEELTEQGLVLRYKVSETDDGLVGDEGSFAICSFWLVSALAEIGETARARALCERLLGFASPLGLFAEEIDATSGRHLGNFPQAFTHLALINAVMHVIRADQSSRASSRCSTPAGGSWRHDCTSPSSRRVESVEEAAAVAPPRSLGTRDRRRPRRSAARRTSRSPAARRRRRRLRAARRQLRDWTGVHLWYGDERCVPLDDPESNHGQATEHARARRGASGTRCPASSGREGRGRVRRASSAGRSSTSRILGHGARRPHRLAVPRPPAARRRRRRGRGPRLAQAAAGARSRSRCDKLNESRRIVLLVTGEGKARGARPRARRAGPRHTRRRCWTATAESSPTTRRWRLGCACHEVWLVRHAETEWSRAGGTRGAPTSR